MADTAPTTADDQATLAQLIDELSSALPEILAAERATSDVTKLLKLNAEYSAIQTLVTQATQAQIAADDALFGQAIVALKKQATMLEDMETQLHGLVDDVEKAAKIVGFIAQAITLLGRL
jgi:hypothetical protein